MLNFKDAFRASAITSIDNFMKRLISLLSMIVLARILSPEDFGLVAISMLALGFVQEATALGGRAYLLSQKSICDDEVFTSWTIGVLVRSFFVLVLLLGSGAISDYYDDERVAPLIYAAASVIVLEFLANPKMIYRHKAQNIVSVVKLGLFTKVCSTAVALLVATYYETYWALMLAHIFRALTFTIGTYFLEPCLPRMTLVNFRPQWEFCKWFAPRSLLNFVRSQLDTFFVSSVYEKAVLGGYNSMKYYTSIPSQILISPLVGPMLTQFSEMKGNRNYLEGQLSVSLLIFFIVSFPLMSLMIIFSEPAINVVLGEKWMEYSRLFNVFSISIFSVGLTNIAINIVYSERYNEKNKQ